MNNTIDAELYGVAKYLLENYPNTSIKKTVFDSWDLINEDGIYISGVY